MTGFPLSADECRLRYPSYDLFGAKVTPTTIADLVDVLQRYIAAGRQCVIASQNLHGLKVMLDIPAFRDLHALPDTYVHIDGMPLVALCRMKGIAASRNQRVTLVDLIWPLLNVAQASGWRVYYLGGTPEILSAGLRMIRQRLPGLQIDGRNGYFNAEDAVANADVLRSIDAYAPDLLLVGMGMGRQEPFILRHLEALAPASICTVGACMEYVAGAVRTPPRWMGRSGLEWLFRLAENPRRFAHRYLVEPWFVAAHVAQHLIGQPRA